MKIVDVLKQSVSCAKRMSVWALALSGLFAPSVGAVTITSVAAQQRLSSNGLVDIAVTFGGTAGDVAKANCTFAATDSATKTALPVLHITRNGNDSGSGNVWTRSFVWDTLADVGGKRIDDVELVVELDGLGGVQLWKNGPCWAECNVGATKPEDYGLYFQWGETVGHRTAGDWSYDCPTYGMKESKLRSLGYINTTGNLNAAHDAATEHLGAPWRMPTQKEFTALCDKCTATWTTYNGVKGRRFIGKGDYASRSVFLPAAGYISSGEPLEDRGRWGVYWSSTSWSDGDRSSPYSWCLSVDADGYDEDFYNCRYIGMPVRPVREFAAASTASTHLMLNCDDFGFVVRFNANDGTPSDPFSQRRIYPATGEMPDQEFSHGVAQNLNECAFIRAGYTFRGWKEFTDFNVRYGDCESINLSESDVSSGIYDLYAVWEANTISITFDFRGFTPGDNYTITHRVGEKFDQGKWSFVDGGAGVNVDGWFTAGGREVGYTDYVPTESTTLYLHWQRKEYTVEFDPNGGSGKMASKKFQYGIATALPANQFVCSGCRFKGWSTIQGGDVEFTDGQEVKKIKSMAGMSSLTVRLYAVWELVARSVTVVFDPMEGTADYTEWTYEIGKPYGRLPNVTRNGYTFNGWRTQPNGGSVVDVNTSAAANVTKLYAWFVPVSYAITYKPGDYGSGEPVVDRHYAGQSATLRGALFTRQGCVQIGWTTVDGGSKTHSFGATYNENKDLTLYAAWVAAPREEDYQCKVVGGEAWITGYKGSEVEILLPSKIGGYPVVGIDAYAFSVSGCVVVSVVIPDGVRSIGDAAFYGCDTLVHVELPNGIESIGTSAFGSCDALKSITVPPCVNVGRLVFYDCRNLRSVTLMPGIREIGEGMFESTAIEGVVIPSSVVAIADFAFRNCKNLTKVTIQNGVQTLGYGVFLECDSLQSIVFPESVVSIGGSTLNGRSFAKAVFWGDKPTIIEKWTSSKLYAPSDCAYYALSEQSGWGSLPTTWDGHTVKGHQLNFPCTIMFDPNGGTGWMDDLVCESGERVYKLPACTFTPPAGKRFAGWRSMLGKRYDDGMLVFGLRSLGGIVMMTAIWE